MAYKASDERYDNTTKYRRCGRSGVMLPEVSLGLWHNFGGVNTFSNCLAIAEYAFDHGVTHFDLANNYGPPYGSAEETFGHIMEQSFRPYRDELFISTKAGYDMWPGPYGNWGSRKYLMASLDQSLERMKLDYVDLFYSHRFDPDTPIEETLQALIDIVHQGKALYIGISRWPKEAFEKAIAYTAAQHVPCLIYQGRLNIFDQAPKKEGILDSVERNGVGFISFSPLAQGLLTNRYLNGIPSDSRMAHHRSLNSNTLTEDRMDQIKALNDLAERRGQSLADMALAWILHHKGITSVLVGASSVEQLADNLRCQHAPEFTEEELSLIEQIVKQ